MQRRERILPVIAACLTALLAAPVHAQTLDPLIEGAKQCTRHLPRYEREYGIPTHLLSAIASTESGRYHEGLGIKIPWPWTINVDGKGYFYPTKQEAINAVRKFKARGHQSIDVGCMQVNLHHHPEAFVSLDQAFEPESNIAYAASFLRALYQEEGSWKRAAADYHSKTPSRGSEYAGIVYNSWYQIIDKLRAARLQTPDASTTQAMNDMKRGPAVTTMGNTKPANVKITRLPEQRGKKVAAYKAPRMNSVRISSRDKERATGVLVVQADKEPATVQPATAMITPTSNVTATPVNDTKIIRLDGTRVMAVPDGKTSAPNFIFSD